jgi:hypothetical protein
MIQQFTKHSKITRNESKLGIGLSKKKIAYSTLDSSIDENINPMNKTSIAIKPQSAFSGTFDSH